MSGTVASGTVARYAGIMTGEGANTAVGAMIEAFLSGKALSSVVLCGVGRSYGWPTGIVPLRQ